MSENFSTPTRRQIARNLLFASAGMAMVASAFAQGNGDIAFGTGCEGITHNYAAKEGQPFSATYGPTGWSSNVWINLNANGYGCAAPPGAQQLLNCGPMTVVAPTPGIDGVPNNSLVKMASTAGFPPSTLVTNWATQVATGDFTSSCHQYIALSVTSDGGGWGDPHLTTVDGVHYDFQSAGEFTALRQKNLEIQTRQTAVPTATVPIENPYTGITHCVAIYTAVATRLGTSRVTLQPGLASGEASAQGLQLRVNGKLTEITDNGVVLKSRDGSTESPAGAFEGAITRTADGTIQIADAKGMQLVVTPAWWPSQNLWYLNVAMYQTSAAEGTMGRIAPGSWLAALPNGMSVGARPASVDQRYQDLYKTFADAWRVTDVNSLFDYDRSRGEGPATFTRSDWPRNHPNSCDIPGQVSLPPTTAAVATQACSGVTDAVQRTNCEFDVAITGQTDFGKTYQAAQSFHPNGAGWVHANPEDNPPAAPTPWWKRLWLWLIGLLAAIF